MTHMFVIMASYLGDYPKCSQNRPEKFCRAVESFLANEYPEKTLIIVSDGCSTTRGLYNEHYSEYSQICYREVEKQPLFSGLVRNEGLRIARSMGSDQDLVCYLDTDDRFGPKHLSVIAQNFGDNDFVVYDTHRVSPNGWYISRVALEYCHIGTSSFAHRLGLSVEWPDGYGHDWGAIKRLIPFRHEKIPMPEYYIHHVPNFDS